jgi:hypothetical protein
MQAFASIHIYVRSNRILEIIKNLCEQFLGEGGLGVG